MEYIGEILKICLPALLVLWACYGTMKHFFANEEKKRNALKNNDKNTIVLRLKAYERLSLFLERINPNNLIQRIHTPNMTCSELQLNLLKTIRLEYEHNLTQQLYVSDEAWETIKLAKESVNQLINSATANVNPDAPALDLARIIIEIYHSSNTTPTEAALKQLKAETVALLS